MKQPIKRHQDSVENATSDSSVEQADVSLATISSFDWLRLIQYVDQGVMLLQPLTLKILAVTPQILSWLGWAEQALLGRSLCDLVLDQGVASLNNTDLSSMGHLGELVLDHQDGSMIWCDAKWMRIDQGMVLVLSNLQEQRALAQERAALQQTHRVHLLSRGVGVELNNPLSTASANLDMAISHMQDSLKIRPCVDIEDALVYLDDSQRGLNRAIGVVRRTLSLQRHDEPAWRTIKVSSFLDKVISQILDRHGDRLLVIKRIEERSLIRCQPEQLEAALNAMFTHALDVLPDGNQQTVELIANRQDSWIAIYAVYHYVEDLGGTISEELSSDRELVLCQVVAESHHGSVELQRNNGLERFSLLLPGIDDGLGDPTSMPIEDKARVLVLDDEPQILRLVRRILSPNYHVTVVSEPSQAMTLIQQDRAIDLMLCDVIMEPLDGMAFYDQIKDRVSSQIRQFSLISGSVDEKELRTFAKVNQIPLLKKPFSAQQLLEHVERLVNRRM